MADPIRDAASATTYRGFSAVDARRDRGAPPVDAGLRRSGALPLALATAAVAAGLAWFLTGAGGDRRVAEPRAPASFRAETPLASIAGDPVLAPRVLPVERTPDPAGAPSAAKPEAVPAARRMPLPVRRAALAQPVQAAPARVRTAFHCDWRLRRSERMICGSPRLAQLDRQLNHAYGEALAAGLPRGGLRREQDAWVLRREAAARSPATLEAYYQRRIRELTAMAARPAAPRARRHRR